jgi:small subunit ribosomal protein S4
MGDPRRLKKKYKTPIHPWQSARIEEEAVLIKNDGLKNKREIWKMEAVLRRFTELAKKVIKASNAQAEKERANMLEQLYLMGLTDKKDVQLDDALSLKINNVMERRLQTIVYKKGYANTMKKARQFITHGHVLVGDRKISSPGHIVTRAEEEKVAIVPESPFASAEHPERTVQRKEIKPKKKENTRLRGGRSPRRRRGERR